MKELQNREEKKDGWARAVVFTFTLVATSANLSEISVSYLPWTAFALAFGLLLPYAFKELVLGRGIGRKSGSDGTSGGFPTFVPTILFLAAICVPVLYGSDAVPALVALGKLSLILLVALPLFFARPKLAITAFYALIAAVWVNFAMMAVGILFGGPTGQQMSPGRWGTILNHPGPLWRLASSVWFYSAYLTVKKRSSPQFLLLLASTTLIFLDGARAGILLMIFQIATIIVILAVERGCLLRIAAGAVVVIIGSLLFFRGSPGLGGIELPDQGAIARVGKFAVSMTSSGGTGLSDADVTRYEMLDNAIQRIHDHPVLGSGFGSTRIMTFAGPEDVHMTYLQIWANLGVAGLFFYVWLSWGWLPRAPRVLRKIREIEDVQTKALYYNAIAILSLFVLGACTYPLGTEWSDWWTFLVAYTLVLSLMLSQAHSRRGPCPGYRSL